MSPETKLLQITNYLILSGVKVAVKLRLDDPKDPKFLTCTSPNHVYKMAFNSHGSTIGYALADNLRREAAGHARLDPSCPFCPTQPKE